jgi:hypothetical protein
LDSSASFSSVLPRRGLFDPLVFRQELERVISSFPPPIGRFGQTGHIVGTGGVPLLEPQDLSPYFGGGACFCVQRRGFPARRLR